MERLHQKSWYALWQHMLKQAVNDVGKLDRKLFSDPSLGGALQKIAEKYTVDVATIQPGASATRRVVEKEGNDGWGGRAQFKQTWLDVSIPFTGEAESFRVSPSRCSIPSQQARIGTNELTISVIDDDNAEAQVKSFTDIVSGNLNTLRAEYAQEKAQMEQHIQQAADRRKAEIAAEDERDNKRSFTVKN
jgi:hypothetical protein